MDMANNMIENCLGIISLPYGLALHFMINGKECFVPMAAEESSVIAAGIYHQQHPLLPSSSRKVVMDSSALPRNQLRSAKFSCLMLTLKYVLRF